MDELLKISTEHVEGALPPNRRPFSMPDVDLFW
jgi:hypothetical protein